MIHVRTTWIGPVPPGRTAGGTGRFGEESQTAVDDQQGTSDHDLAFAASRLDRDRTLQAVHRLEAALAMAAGVETWLPEVIADLGSLEAAMTDERREMDRPDALTAMIRAEHPRRFGPRIRSLHAQYDDIIRQVGSLRSQLEGTGEDHPDAADLRQRVGWVIRAIHHCRAQQTDLVYEALALDLGER